MPTDLVRGLKAHGTSPAKAVFSCVWIVTSNRVCRTGQLWARPAGASGFRCFPLFFPKITAEISLSAAEILGFGWRAPLLPLAVSPCFSLLLALLNRGRERARPFLAAAYLNDFSNGITRRSSQPEHPPEPIPRCGHVYANRVIHWREPTPAAQSCRAACKDDIGAPDQANAAIYTFREYK